MLHITDITYRIGSRTLFDAATLGIPAGHKVGLVGRNGTGKTTLFKMILSELGPESGTIQIHPTATVGHVSQEAPDGDTSLIDTVLQSNQELTILEAEAETATDPARIADIHTRLADIGAHTARSRAASLLKGLGFSDTDQLRPCKEFSGGWRMRVALASVLFNEPDFLLLDEPTNYLDLEGVIWLEDFLRRYPYTVVIISHDRDLLNKAVTHIAHLENGKLNLYTGGYDSFEKLRRENQARQMALKSKQESERRHMEAFVERFRYKASKAKQAQSRLKALEKMQPIASVVDAHTVPFQFPKPEPLSSPLVALEEVTAGYEVERPIFPKLDLRIDMDDRIALLGANGNGKSTFAKLVSERLKPFAGKLRRSRSLGVGYFAQHQLDELNPKGTPFDHLAKLMPDSIEAKVRARLGGFGFGADKADREVASLSGGEKARLMFAMATFHAPHLLILDEPTNHLDVDSREALAHAINAYDGAVLLISHDRHLVEACVDRLWLVEGGTVAPFDGDLEDYKRHLLMLRAEDRRSGRDAKEDIKKIARKSSAEERQRLAPLRKAVAEAEKRMADLTKKRDTMATKLANPKVYEGPQAATPEQISKAQQRLADYETALEEAESDWLEAEEALEAAQAD